MIVITLNFVVTGGAGFIGSHLASKLIEKHNHSVRIVDNLQSGNMENIKKIKPGFNKIDILDYEKLEGAISQSDGIFHLAALTDPFESFEKPEEYHKVNVLGSENVFKIANRFGIKVVFASSAAVYGNAVQIPIKENHEKNPLNPYAVSKTMAEDMATRYVGIGTRIVCLRYFNVYGKSDFESQNDVISKFMKNISSCSAPIIYGDGSQTRDFVHVEDVVRASMSAMQSNVDAGFFNIGSGTATSVFKLAKEIICAANLDLEPAMTKAPSSEIRHSKADIELAKNVLRWVPKKNLAEWINQLIPKK